MQYMGTNGKEMREVIVIEKDELMGLSVLIAESIIRYSKESYGFTMISRDTNKAMGTEAMLGALAPSIHKALRGKK